MKILITNDAPTAHYFIRVGFARALTYAGHEVVIWDIDKKNAFDAFAEFEPDIFVGQTYNLSPAILKCLANRPNIKITLKAPDWSDYSNNLDSIKYPILKIQQDGLFSEIDKVQKLLKINKISFLDIHYPQKYANITHDFWNKKLGLKVVGLMSGTDVFDYTGGKFKQQYKSDIIFIGGRWGYKQQTIDPWLIPLTYRGNNIDFKIFGNQGWNIPQYYGYLPTEYVKDFLASAVICPNISEPHSQDLGFDVIERPFKLLSNRCFVISDYVQGLVDLIPDGIVYAKNPESFMDLCIHYLKYPEERLPIIERGYQAVINNHTYFHRAAQFFNELDMPQEASKVMESFSSVREKLCLS